MSETPRVEIVPVALSAEDQRWRREAALRILAAKASNGDILDPLAVLTALELADEILVHTRAT